MTKIEVSVTVKRGSKSKTYLLSEEGESKKGTFLTRSLKAENEDMPRFTKVYIKAKQAKPKGKKS